MALPPSPPPASPSLAPGDVLHLLQAARAGLAEAGFALGLAHEFGLGGLPPDLELARHWFRRTACLSPREPTACCRRRVQDPASITLYREALEPILRALGLEVQGADPYARSFGPRALRAPFRWYARPDVDPTARAEFAMARLVCLEGPGSRWCPTPWFRRAAEAGLPEAHLQLGLLLGSQADSSGSSGARRRSREAFRRARTGLRRLALRGNREAWYRLGVMLLEGWGACEEDPAGPASGRKWLARAAAEGHPDAARRLEASGRPPPRSPEATWGIASGRAPVPSPGR